MSNAKVTGRKNFQNLVYFTGGIAGGSGAAGADYKLGLRHC